MRHPLAKAATATVAICTALVTITARAEAADSGGFCSTTAQAQMTSCQKEVTADLFEAGAICLNVANDAEREDCYAEANSERAEGRQLCDAQFGARKNLCAALGEARYDPAFEPADFDTDFTSPPNLNPYHPVQVGYQWEYSDGEETIDIEVLNDTKLIAGVTCAVVRDRAKEDGVLVEDTKDWFAQAKNGDVWYCGEEAKDFETFDGDSPARPELVSIEGSFKAGRDGDKPGLLFPGVPKVGAVYRQEFSVGNAEDAVTVLSTTYKFGSNPELDQFVPRALAKRFCATRDCVVTRDFSPLDPSPDAVERKYYAKGVGLFFEVHETTGEGVHLTNCNFDSRCTALPAP